MSTKQLKTRHERADALEKLRLEFGGEESPITLLDIFESESKYNLFMKLLVKEEKCQPQTYIWKDEDKANKGYLAAMLKWLHKQGYYKDNKRPSNEEIQEIAQNTFGWKMGIDTVKKAKFTAFNFDFIPPAISLR